MHVPVCAEGLKEACFSVLSGRRPRETMFSDIIHKSAWIGTYYFRGSADTANLSDFESRVWEKHLLFNRVSPTMTR